MKITRIVALLGLVFLSCLSDVVTGGRWASCSRYFSSRGTDLRCRESFEPVCGTDGVTYPNECSLCMEMRRCKTVDKQHDGRCVQASCSRYFLFRGTDLRCRESFEPVCGTDGVTYPNECSLCMEMRHKVVEKKHDGRCVQINCAGHLRANDGDDRICTREYNPICATNGITYANQCKFCAAVANGADIDLFRLGECLQVDCSDYLRAKDICTFEYEPVCGSDGKTYRNKCQFCYSVQRSNKLLFLKRLGGC